jgi:chemotaxis protein histidine kinase CheA
MNSLPNPKQTNPHDVAVAALEQAYEQFGRADEQLARVEQVSKLEQDAAPHPSDPPTRINTFHPAVPGDRPSLGGRAIRGFIGFLFVVCIGVAAFVWLSPFYGDAARQIIARWAPQLVPTSSLTLESPGLPAQPSPPTVQAAAAKTAPPQPAPLAQTAPEDVAPTAAALSPESAQLLQSMARDLATVGQEIEQLKTSQAQMVRDNAELVEQLKTSQAQMVRDNAELAEQLKAAQAQMVRDNAELAKQLRASQEQMARSIAKASEQNLRPKTSAPPPRPIATPTRKPVPKPSSPQATAKPQAEPVSRPLTPLR